MNKKLKATHSHFIAERDRLIAELDILLNGQTGSDSLDKVFNTFREMAVVNVAISNIEAIMADNNTPQPQGISLDQFGELSRMADAIRQKMDEENGLSGNDNNNQ